MAKRKRRSIGDRLRRTQKRPFVGREDHIKTFRDNLALTPDHDDFQFICNVFGQGGVGKSTLVERQFIPLAKVHAYATVRIDTEDQRLREVTATMNAIAEQLIEQGAKFTAFTKMYKKYQQEKGRLETDPERPKGTFGTLVTEGLKIGGKFGRLNVPVVGGFISDDLIDSTAKIAGDWTNFVATKLQNKDEVELLLYPLKILTPLWLEELYNYADDHHIAIFLDTYEAANPALDKWLFDLIKGHYGDAPENLLLCIVGRDPLDSGRWNEISDFINKIPLEPFSEAEAREFLAKRNISNPAVVEQIISLSNLLPVYLSLLAEGDPATPDEVVDQNETVVERFLRHIEQPILRQIVERAALPRKLNQDVLECLLPDKLPEGWTAKSLFEWLIDRPFVQKRGGYWVYHPVVRDSMLRYFRDRSLSDFRTLHLKLGKYYHQFIIQLGTVDQTIIYQSKDWSLNRIESHYHLLCADYRKHINEVLNDVSYIVCTIPNSMYFSLLVTSIYDSEKILRIKEGWSGLVLPLIGALEVNDNDKILPFVKKVNDGNWIESSYLKSNMYFLQGNCENQVEPRLDCYNKALSYDTTNGGAYNNRGLIYIHQKKWDLALNDFNNAIKFIPLIAFPFYNRGRVYYYTQKWDLAKIDYNTAIKIDPTQYHSYMNLGLIYYKKEEYNKAEELYLKSLDLYSNDVDVYNNLGLLYMKTREHVKAIDIYTRALKVVSVDENQLNKSKITLMNRANSYAITGKYTLAIADMRKLIQIEPNSANCYAILGYYLTLKTEFTEAISNLNKAIELDNSLSGAWESLANVYAELNQENKVLECIDKALELNSQNNEMLMTQAVIYFNKGLLDLAYKIFSKVSIKNVEHSTQATINLAFIDIARNRLTGLKDKLLKAWEDSDHKNAFAPKNLAHLALIAGDEAEALRWYQIALDTETNVTEHLQTDYNNLKLEEKGITRADYDQLLAQLKNQNKPFNKP